MSLRLRLTFLCVALVAVVLASFAVGTYFLANRRITASFDDSLVAQTDAILSILPPGPLTQQLVDQRRHELDLQADAGRLFQIRTNDGHVLYTSFRGTPELLPRNKPLDRQVFFQASVGQERLRLVYLPR